MKLTCSQMDVLITFYIDGDLSKSLKNQVEEHLKSCPSCRAKLDIIKSMINEIRSEIEEQDDIFTNPSLQSNKSGTTSLQYRVFKNNLSAYIDNELDSEENIKIKKFAINNKHARQELEDSYNIRKLMNDSFRKTRSEAKHDFSKSVLKQLDLEEEASLGIHPAIKIIIGFSMSVMILTVIVLFSLNM